MYISCIGASVVSDALSPPANAPAQPPNYPRASRRRSGLRLRSHSRTGRSPGTRLPWRNPRPSRDAVEPPGPIAVALAARNDRLHDPPGHDYAWGNAVGGDVERPEILRQIPGVWAIAAFAAP